MVEAVIAIGLIGLGVAGSITALIKMNTIASMNRNNTGAYTAVMNEIDTILSHGPFNPQKINEVTGRAQIPDELQLGTRTKPVPIYREPVTVTWEYPNATTRTGAGGFSSADIGKLAFDRDTRTYWKLASAAPTWMSDSGGVIVLGEMTTQVTTPNPPTTYNGVPLYIYRATVTVTYKYLNRDYSFSMSTLRTSDI